MEYFVTSDTHFGHENIIKLCKRPFSSVAEMDEVIIENWNSVVAKDDIVVHLGDFCYKNSNDVTFYKKQLNGKIIFVPGNHDKFNFSVMDEVARQCDVFSGVVVSHYPLEEWNGFYRGVVHFHGHCHGTMRKIKNRLDVGVDTNNFMPIHWDEAIDMARSEV